MLFYDPDAPDPMIFDAPLTELGERQARQTQIAARNLPVDRIIVSPLTRTLQTAALIFQNSLPMQVNALVREQLTNSCDVGRPPHELAVDYPHLEFDHLDDCWWHDEEKDHRGISVEPHSTLQDRADSFVHWLQQERVHSVAIVTHGNFIRALTGVQPDNCQILQLDVG